MSVKIRLTRIGAKKRPYYRIVVADSRYARDGRVLENVGTYDPMEEKGGVSVKQDRLNFWLEKGATPSDTVKSLISKAAKAS